MGDQTSSNLTQLLDAAAGGGDAARERLWALVHDELRCIAHRQMTKEASRRTLQTTVLIQEAYLRLAGGQDVHWSSRRHFFAAAAQAMRRICVDDARKKGRMKRGGGQQALQLDEEPAIFDLDPAEVVAVDDALEQLERAAPRQAEVVKLRYFAGFTVHQTAEALGMSPRTVDSEWRYARAWLHRALRDGDTDVPM